MISGITAKAQLIFQAMIGQNNIHPFRISDIPLEDRTYSNGEFWSLITQSIGGKHGVTRKTVQDLVSFVNLYVHEGYTKHAETPISLATEYSQQFSLESVLIRLQRGVDVGDYQVETEKKEDSNSGSEIKIYKNSEGKVVAKESDSTLELYDIDVTSGLTIFGWANKTKDPKGYLHMMIIEQNIGNDLSVRYDFVRSRRHGEKNKLVYNGVDIKDNREDSGFNPWCSSASDLFNFSDERYYQRDNPMNTFIDRERKYLWKIPPLN